VVPLLAAQVPTLQNGGVQLRADGGMDVTWTLRPGVHWHDGMPLTSADVKFTVDAINGPNYNPESTDGFDRIASVETPDPLTALVHYREIYAPYDIQFIRGMLPKHRLEGRDIDRAQDYNRSPLGTGPYRVAEWKAGEYILLERVPDYWRGAEYPRIRRLMFKFIANTNTRINQLKSGEVHLVALVPWDKYREIAGLPSIVVHKTPGNAYEHVTLNERHFPPFADVRGPCSTRRAGRIRTATASAIAMATGCRSRSSRRRASRSARMWRRPSSSSSARLAWISASS
jgi:peptide/nickel transport system substrate-binding protein